MRSLTALAAVLLVCGCSLPTPFSMATMAFDVGSYVISGKTMTDHGLSLVAQQDCQLSRIVEGEICRVPLDVEDAGPTLEALTDQQVAALLDQESIFAVGSEKGQEDHPFVMGFIGSSPTMDVIGTLNDENRIRLRVGAYDRAVPDPLRRIEFLSAKPRNRAG
jgi:hypothetical protein